MNFTRKIALTGLFVLMFPFTAFATSTLGSIEDTNTADIIVFDNTEMPPVQKRLKTHSQDILFRFYKLSSIAPDFDTWTERSPKLAEAQEIDKKTVFINEFNRLKTSYLNYKDDDLITVHARLPFSKYSELQETLFLDQLSAQTFFGFTAYGENIAIVPKAIERFSKMRMTQTKHQSIKQLVGNTDDLIAEILLKPLYVDDQKPFVQEKTKYWLMLADIAEIRVWDANQENTLVWFHRSDWYEPEINNELLELYDRRESETSEKETMAPNPMDAIE